MTDLQIQLRPALNITEVVTDDFTFLIPPLF